MLGSIVVKCLIAVPQDLVESAIRTLAQPLVASEEVPGLVIAWIDAEDHEYNLALGKRGREDDSPMLSDGIFEIGSLTKLFTGLTLAQLSLTKEIDLHATIDSLLPAAARPPTESGVELIQLATHRGGMPDIPSNLERDTSRFVVDYSQYDEAKLGEFLRGFTPSPKPGRRYLYSNAGYGVLGYGLAQRMALPFDRLVATRVIEPLELASTSFAVDAKDAKRALTGHDPNGDPVAPMEFAALSGCGGLRSSASDLLRFARAFLEPAGPLADAIELASTPVAKTSQGVGIALDWNLALDGETFFHSGQTSGFTAFICFHRDKHLAVVALANGVTPQLELLGVGVLRTLLGVPVTPLTVRLPVKLGETKEQSAQRLAPLVGSYTLNPTTTMTVTALEDRLYAQLPGQPSFRLLPQIDGSFTYRSIDATIEFEREENANAAALDLRQNGRRVHFERSK